MREQREHHSTCLTIPDSLNTLSSSGCILRFTTLCIIILAGWSLGFSSHNAIYSRRVENTDKKYPRWIRQICLASLVRGREDRFVLHPWYRVDKTDLSRILVRGRENRFVSHPWYKADKTNLPRILGRRVDKTDSSRILGPKWIRQVCLA